MDLPMVHSGYLPTVQMRIGKNTTLTGLHLVQPQCVDIWRLFICCWGMAYKLTLPGGMAILHFIVHHLTVTSTLLASYSNMGRTSVHKMRTARCHYIWRQLEGGSMSHIYCLPVAQTYM